MHELQSLLLQKLPRLGELTFGCEVKSDYGISTVISSLETDGEEWMTFKLWDGTIGGEEHVSSVGSFEIIGHPFTHADILEALGEDFVMSGNYQIYATTDSSISDNCYPYFTNGCRLAINYVDKYNDKYTFPKLPSNISDLSLPEYEETRKQLISLLTK